jgi:hypothetical protein
MTFLIENEYYKELCYLIDEDSKLICKISDEYSIYKNIFNENHIIKIKEHIVIATLELSSLISSAYRYFMPALYLSDIQTKIYYKKNKFIKEDVLKIYENILRHNLLLNTKYIFPILEKIGDSDGLFKWVLDYDEIEDKVYYINEKEDYNYSICKSSNFKIKKEELISLFSTFENNIRISKLIKELEYLKGS